MKLPFVLLTIPLDPLAHSYIKIAKIGFRNSPFVGISPVTHRKASLT